MTVTSNSVWFCSSVSWTAVTAWAASTAYTVGQLRRQLATPTVGNERVFVCIIAGTSLGSEPTWTITQGAKTAEAAGPTWQECTGKAAVNGDLADTPLSSANRSGAQVLGQIIKNNAGTYYFICTTAGTTGSGEPSYTLTAGVTTVDSGCTWTCLGAVGGFSSWGAPAARYELIGTTFTSGSTTSDRFFLSSDHTQTTTAALNLALGLNKSAISVNKAGSVPPVTADITSGATLICTGAFQSITIAGGFWQGIIFSTGGTSNSVGMTVGFDSVPLTLKSCALTMTGSGGGQMILGYTGAYGNWLLDQCQISLNAGAATPLVMSGRGVWRGSTAAGFATSTFAVGIGLTSHCNLEFRDLDLSAIGVTVPLFSWSASALADCRVALINCKLTANIPIIGSVPLTPGVQIDLINCDSGSTNYRNEFYRTNGTIITSAAAYRSGGASDGTTPVSHAYHALSQTAGLNFPLEGPPLFVWNTTTGSSVTATVEIAGGGTPTTLDPAHGFQTVALSNGLLTALNAGSTWYGIRSTASFTAGKIYAEFTAVAKPGALMLGICNALYGGISSGAYPGSEANSMAYYSAGQSYTNGSGSGSFATYTAGDVICVAVDISAAKIWWRKNGGNWNNDVIGNQNPATATGGTSISAILALNGTLYFAGGFLSAGDSFTFNAGNTAFAQTAPSGFSGVLTTPGVTLTNADVWLDVEYLSASGTPLGQVATSGVSVLATSPGSVTSSASSWTGLTSPVTQKLQVSFTPQKVGLVRANVKVANSSVVVSVDPKLAVA